MSEDFKTRVQKRCAACQAPFVCGAGEPECWCQELPALEPVPGRDCLCKACLEKELKCVVPAEAGTQP